MSVPHTVFIIPYKDRLVEKKGLDLFFNKLRIDRKWTKDDMKIIYVHQEDPKRFNRGAMKNIGFLYMKNKYPFDYKNITFIFHDVDFHPITTDLLNYSTKKGVVEHYYGYTFVLGGIFSIKGSDFEKIGGFPNFWGWGFEDNVLYDRCKDEKHNITVDRSNFYKIGDKNIVYINENGDKGDGIKTVSNRDIAIFYNEEKETFNHIRNLKYNENENDNMLNVIRFDTGRNYNEAEFETRNLTETGGRVYLKKGYWRRSWKFNNIRNLNNTNKSTKPAPERKPSTNTRTWKLF